MNERLVEDIVGTFFTSNGFLAASGVDVDTAVERGELTTVTLRSRAVQVARRIYASSGRNPSRNLQLTLPFAAAIARTSRSAKCAGGWRGSSMMRMSSARQNPRPSPFSSNVPTVPSVISNIAGNRLTQGLLAAGQYWRLLPSIAAIVGMRAARLAECRKE